MLHQHLLIWSMRPVSRQAYLFPLQLCICCAFQFTGNDDSEVAWIDPNFSKVKQRVEVSAK